MHALSLGTGKQYRIRKFLQSGILRCTKYQGFGHQKKGCNKPKKCVGVGDCQKKHYENVLIARGGGGGGGSSCGHENLSRTQKTNEGILSQRKKCNVHIKFIHGINVPAKRSNGLKWFVKEKGTGSHSRKFIFKRTCC